MRKIGDTVNYRGLAGVHNPCRILEVRDNINRPYILLSSDRMVVEVGEANIVDKKPEVYKPIDIYNLLVAFGQTREQIAEGMGADKIYISGEYIGFLYGKFRSMEVDHIRLNQYLCRLLDRD